MRLPLENHALERAILGSLLTETDVFWQYKDRAKAELFTVTMHGRLIGIMHALVEDAKELSVPAIISRLGRDDNSDFSPEGYLATLISDEAEPENLQAFFADLEDMWARRQMAKLGAELIKQSTADTGLDAMSRLEKAKENIEELGDPMGTSVTHIMTIAQNVVANVQAATDRERTVGIAPGIKGVQDLTGPFMPGRVYLLGGPPGSGKTALAFQVGMEASKTVPVLFCEAEMTEEEMVQRDMAGATGIPGDRIERAALNNDEIDQLFEAGMNYADYKFYLDTSTSPSVAQIRAKAMRMKRLKGLGMLIVDHLLYMRKPGDARQSEFDGIRQNMQGFKRIAKDLGIPVIVLTQLKKEYGTGPWNLIRRPSVDDLYGGSAPEQESDVVLFIHREEYLMGRKEPPKDAKDYPDWLVKMEAVKGKAELVLGKRRGGHGFGVRTLYFDAPRVRFADQAPRTAMAQTSLLTQDDIAAAQNM